MPLYFRYRLASDRTSASSGPVCAAAVLAEGDIAVDQRGFYRRELGGPHILFAQQPIHRPGPAAARNMPLASTHPSPLVAPALMNTGRGAHSATSSCESTGRSFQFSGPGVLQEVAGHPVILAGGGDVLHQFAPVAAMDLGAAFARGADVGDRKTRVVRHRDEGCLAVARVAFDADLFGVHGLVGLEIIERAAGAPGPGAQRAPIVRLARLALVDQTDDALRQTRAVVGLDAAGGQWRSPSPSRAPAVARSDPRGRVRARRIRRTRSRRARTPRPPRPEPPRRAEAEGRRGETRRTGSQSIITGTGPVALAGVESAN